MFHLVYNLLYFIRMFACQPHVKYGSLIQDHDFVEIKKEFSSATKWAIKKSSQHNKVEKA